MAIGTSTALAYSAASGASPAGGALDCLVAVAFRDNNTTAPSLPSGWITPTGGTAGGSSCSFRIAFSFAPSAAAVTPTFTNATRLTIIRVPGCYGIGAVAFAAIASSNSMSYPAIASPVQSGGTSKFLGFGCHRSASNVDTAPTNMSLISGSTAGTGPMIAAFISAALSSWSAQTATVDATLGRCSGVMELLGASSTWNPYVKVSGISLSSANEAATVSGDEQFVAATFPRNGGKWLISMLSASPVWNAFGFVKGVSTYGAGQLPGYGNSDGVCLLGVMSGPDTGYVFYSETEGTQISTTVPAVGDDIFWALNQDDDLLWVKIESGGWNGDPLADPATNTGGIPIPSGLIGELLVPFGWGDTGAVFWYDSSPAVTVSGYSLWDYFSSGYTLTAASGSFAMSGNAAGLLAGRKILAASGSFAVTGIAATLRYGKRFVADAGTFAVTGYAAGLSVARRLAAAYGSFAVTGNAAALNYFRRLVAAVGSFTVTGFDATLAVSSAGYRLIAAAGSFAVTGFSAGIIAARKISAAHGSFTVTGYAATLKAARRLVAAAGTYAVTGIAANLLAARKLVAAYGAFTVTGYDATFQRGKILVAGYGSFLVAAMSAALKRAAIFRANAGTFGVTGQDAEFSVERMARWDPAPENPATWANADEDTETWTEQGPGASPWSEV